MDYTPKIAKKDLLHGTYYMGRCRNASIARWDANEQVFIHWRTKFGHRFTETIRHPDDEQHYDVFVVEALATPEEISQCEPIPLNDSEVVIPPKKSFDL